MRTTTIQARTAILASSVIVTTVVLLVAVGAWQSARFSTAASDATDALIESNLDDVTRGVRDVVRAQGDAVQQQVDGSLEVARYVAVQAGGFAEGDGEVTWTARNQFTQDEQELTLPPLEVGGEWFGQDTSLEVRMPLVDQVRELVGGTVTVFQRMNPEGDMLRVATNVRTLDDTRAIGTYIPAIGPDGTPNPVVGTVLGGETFRGNAFVVNAWYATAYEPILSSSGEVVGMLYVGVPQENVPSLRAAIVEAQVGTSGEVLAVGASGAGKGEVRIAGELEGGTPLLEELDAEGVPYVEALIDAAVAAEPGTVVRAEHRLGDDAETTLLRATYYAPWDWVIVATAPASDFQAAHEALTAGRTQMIIVLVVTGIAAAVVLGAVASRWGARSIGGPVSRSAVALGASGRDLTALGASLSTYSETTADQATRASATGEQVASNVASVATAVEELDASVREIAQHATEASTVAVEAVERARATNATVAKLGESSAEIGSVVGLITSIAEQTNLLALNATIEAARAGDAGRGFAVVAGEVKHLATETQDATAQISSRVEAIQAQTAEAVEAIERITTVIERIADLQNTIAGAVEEQSATSREIARSVSEAAGGVGDIAGSVHGVAAAAEQTNGAARDTREAAAQLTELAAQLQALVGSARGGVPEGTDGGGRSGRGARGDGSAQRAAAATDDAALGPESSDPSRQLETIR